MPSPRCDAGANLTGWRHSWDEVVEFTFTTVEDECREETAVPKTQIAGLALSYLCRYLTLAEDDSLTGGGGGTQGWSTGAAASGRRPAGVRNRSDPGEIGSSTLVSIMAAFKHLAGVHPSYDDHFCKLWPAARLTKARPRSPSPPPLPPARPRPRASSPHAPARSHLRALRPRAPAPRHPRTRAAPHPPHPPLPSATRPCSRRTSSSWCRRCRSAPTCPISHRAAPPTRYAVPRRAPPSPAAPRRPRRLLLCPCRSHPPRPPALCRSGGCTRATTRRTRRWPTSASRSATPPPTSSCTCASPPRPSSTPATARSVLPPSAHRTLPHPAPVHPRTPIPTHPHTHTHPPLGAPPPKLPPVLARRRRHA